MTRHHPSLNHIHFEVLCRVDAARYSREYWTNIDWLTAESIQVLHGMQVIDLERNPVTATCIGESILNSYAPRCELCNRRPNPKSKTPDHCELCHQ